MKITLLRNHFDYLSDRYTARKEFAAKRLHDSAAKAIASAEAVARAHTLLPSDAQYLCGLADPS